MGKGPKPVRILLTPQHIHSAASEAMQYTMDNPNVVLDVALVASGAGSIGVGYKTGRAGAAIIRQGGFGSTTRGIMKIEKGYRKKVIGAAKFWLGAEQSDPIMGIV